MKPGPLVALVVVGLGITLAVCVAWARLHEDSPTAAVVEPPVPPATVSPSMAAKLPADEAETMPTYIGDRVIDGPASNASQGAAPAVVPVPSARAVAALRESMENGDPRTPPLARSTNLREMPSAEELADPGLYQQYEMRQKQQVYASFVTAANRKIGELESLIEQGEAFGIDPEQLAEGQRKLAGLMAQRDQLLEQHPELVEPEPGQE